MSRRFNAPHDARFQTYESLVAELREIALLGSVCSVLGWDEQTHMPAAGAGLRANQASLLARMVHERFTSRASGIGWRRWGRPTW